MNVPFFSLDRHITASKADLLTACDFIFDSQQFIGGPAVERFEKKFAQYLGVKHVISCNSGTDALWLAFKALQTPAKSIVLTTPFSFIASSSEIVAHAANPVFIDIDQETYTMDADLLAAWLVKHAKRCGETTIHNQTGLPIVGIATVDLFGQSCNYERISAIAKEWHLWIVEDACQAVGAQYQGKAAGTHGTIGAFSFYPTKNLGACGDGGCCVTNDDELAQTLRILKHHGRTGSATNYHYAMMGICSRMDALQAQFLAVKLENLSAANERRREIASMYQQRLSDLSMLTLPVERYGAHVYHQFSIALPNKELRAAFITHLNVRGVGTNIFYPQSFTEIPFLNQNAELVQLCPVADDITQRIVSLPIWPELQNKEVAYVCDVIHEFATNVQLAPLQGRSSL